MANGYRISEASDFRVTEDGASRLTEGYSIVDSSLVASGTAAVSGYKYMYSSSNLTAVGSRIVVGERTRAALASLSATSSIVTLSLLKNLGYVNITGVGTSEFDGRKRQYAEGSYTGTCTLDSIGLKTLYGSITSGTDIVTRITEAGDIRVTEDGLDTRTVLEAYGNIIFATIVGNPSKTFFSSIPYYNEEDTWKTFLPYVKHNGTWKSNIKIYKHTNGAWKRSY
jgi:hypothetical protein